MEFYLNCWVPSLSGFFKLKELKNSQLSILSKYILNEDHEGTNMCFNEIINKNFLEINPNLNVNRFDKWFILSFLRATNISPILYLQTANTANVPCNIELSLYETLTRLSEISPVSAIDVKLENINIILYPSESLYTVEPVVDSVKELKHLKNNITNRDEIYKLLGRRENLRNYLAQQMLYFDSLSNDLIIKNENPALKLTNIPVRVFDNTLFFFLRSIYLPYCKGVYEKLFSLKKLMNLSLDEYYQLTPSECDILISLYKQDESSKTQHSYSLQQ